MNCDYCGCGIHSEEDGVILHGRPKEDAMPYHRWCYERVAEAEQEIKTGERVEDLL